MILDLRNCKLSLNRVFGRVPQSYKVQRHLFSGIAPLRASEDKAAAFPTKTSNKAMKLATPGNIPLFPTLAYSASLFSSVCI